MMNLNELHNIVVGSWSKLLQFLIGAKDRIFKMKPFNLKIFETVVILLSLFIGVFLAKQYPVDKRVRIHEVDIKGISVPTFFEKLDLCYHTIWNFIVNVFQAIYFYIKNFVISLGRCFGKLNLIRFLMKLPLFLWKVLTFMVKPLFYLYHWIVELAKLTFNFVKMLALKLWHINLPKFNLMWFLKPFILLWKLLCAPFITLYHLILNLKLTWIIKPLLSLKDLGIKFYNIVCNFFVKLWNLILSIRLGWFFKPFIAIWRFICLSCRMVKLIAIGFWNMFSIKAIIRFLLRPFVLVWDLFKRLRCLFIWLFNNLLSINIIWWILKPFVLLWKFICNIFAMIKFIFSWTFAQIKGFSLKIFKIPHVNINIPHVNINFKAIPNLLLKPFYSLWNIIKWPFTHIHINFHINFKAILDFLLKPFYLIWNIIRWPFIHIRFNFHINFKAILNFLLKPFYLIWSIIKWPFTHIHINFHINFSIFTKPFTFTWCFLVKIGSWFRGIHFRLPNFGGFFSWLLKPLFAVWRFLCLVWRFIAALGLAAYRFVVRISLSVYGFFVRIPHAFCDFLVSLKGLWCGWGAILRRLLCFLLRPFALLRVLIAKLLIGLRLLWSQLLLLLSFLMRPLRMLWFALGQIRLVSFAGLKDFWDNVCEPEMLN